MGFAYLRRLSRELIILKAFDDAQLGAAGAWVELDFFARGVHRAGREEAEDASRVVPWFGPLGPVDPFGAAIPEEGFHDTILQGMEADHGKARAVGEPEG